MSILAKLNDVSVGKKLGAGFAILVLLTAMVAAIAIDTLDAYNQRSIIVAEVSEAESYLLDARVAEKNYQLRRDDQYLASARNLVDKAAETVLPLKALLVVPADHARVDFMAENVKTYKNQLDELARAMTGRPDAIVAAEAALRETGLAVVDKAVELQEVQVQRMKTQFTRATALLLTVTVSALVVAVAIAWFMIRSITLPIRQAVEVTNRVADGDLTVQVESKRGDEFGALLAAVATMVTKLRDLIQQIDSGASNIASSSEELSAVTEQTRQGVVDQSDRTDQVATAMNEMVATVNDVAKSAEAAFEAAQRASQTSSEGESAVNQTLEYVTDLNTKNGEVMDQLRGLQSDTQNIVTVLDVIKSVADQTNLLALNAAIEAARAGEQGRGFAVVADEVRSLAQRTQTSAEEIETLINNLVGSAESSFNNMEAGIRLAEQTLAKAEVAGGTIREMAQAVEDIRQYNSQIATAAEQQSSVAEDINQNVTHIRDVGEQSATSAEQVSAASEELARLAEGLSVQIGQFRV